MKGDRDLVGIERSLGLRSVRGISRQSNKDSPPIKDILDGIRAIATEYVAHSNGEIRASDKLRQDALDLLAKHGTDIWPPPDEERPPWLEEPSEEKFDGKYPRHLYFTNPVDRNILEERFYSLVVEKCCNYHDNQLQKHRRVSAKTQATHDDSASATPRREDLPWFVDGGQADGGDTDDVEMGGAADTPGWAPVNQVPSRDARNVAAPAALPSPLETPEVMPNGLPGVYETKREPSPNTPAENGTRDVAMSSPNGGDTRPESQADQPQGYSWRLEDYYIDDSIGDSHSRRKRKRRQTETEGLEAAAKRSRAEDEREESVKPESLLVKFKVNGSQLANIVGKEPRPRLLSTPASGYQRPPSPARTASSIADGSTYQGELGRTRGRSKLDSLKTHQTIQVMQYRDARGKWYEVENIESRPDWAVEERAVTRTVQRERRPCTYLNRHERSSRASSVAGSVAQGSERRSSVVNHEPPEEERERARPPSAVNEAGGSPEDDPKGDSHMNGVDNASREIALPSEESKDETQSQSEPQPVQPSTTPPTTEFHRDKADRQSMPPPSQIPAPSPARAPVHQETPRRLTPPKETQSPDGPLKEAEPSQSPRQPPQELPPPPPLPPPAPTLASAPPPPQRQPSQPSQLSRSPQHQYQIVPVPTQQSHPPQPSPQHQPHHGHPRPLQPYPLATLQSTQPHPVPPPPAPIVPSQPLHIQHIHPSQQPADRPAEREHGRASAQLNGHRPEPALQRKGSLPLGSPHSAVGTQARSQHDNGVRHVKGPTTSELPIQLTPSVNESNIPVPRWASVNASQPPPPPVALTPSRVESEREHFQEKRMNVGDFRPQRPVPYAQPPQHAAAAFAMQSTWNPDADHVLGELADCPTGIHLRGSDCPRNLLAAYKQILVDVPATQKDWSLFLAYAERYRNDHRFHSEAIKKHLPPPQLGTPTGGSPVITTLPPEDRGTGIREPNSFARFVPNKPVEVYGVRPDHGHSGAPMAARGPQNGMHVPDAVTGAPHDPRAPPHGMHTPRGSISVEDKLPLRPSAKKGFVEEKVMIGSPALGGTLDNVSVEINWGRQLDFADYMNMQDCATARELFELVEAQLPDELRGEGKKIREIRIKAVSGLAEGARLPRITRDEGSGRVALRQLMKKLKSQPAGAEIELEFTTMWDL